MAKLTGKIGEFTFGGWNGQLVRPQKQLDLFRRTGSTGSEFQIVNTFGPDCTINTKLFTIAQAEAVDIRDEILELQGTVQQVTDPFGTVYQRVIVKQVSSVVKAIRGIWENAEITHCVECSWILEVLPEDQ